MELLKPAEAAKQLRVKQVTIYQWCRRGVLPFFKLENCVRIDQQDLIEFVKCRRVEARKIGNARDSMSLEVKKA